MGAYDIDFTDRIQAIVGTSAINTVLNNISTYSSLITQNPSAAAVQAIYASPQWSSSGGQPPPASIRYIVDGRVLAEVPFSPTAAR